MNEADIKLTEQYVTGQLDKAGEEAFRLRLAAEPELLAEFSLQWAVFEGRRVALEQEVGDLIAQEADTQRRGRIRTIGLTAFASLAAAVLVWFLIRWATPPSPQQLFAKYFEAATNTSSVLDTDQDRFEQALAQYDAKAYEDALALFADLDSLPVVRQQEVAFYSANAYLATSQYDQAIPILETLQEVFGSALAPEATYYLGLAYLASGRIEEALDRFQKVEADQLVGKEQLLRTEEIIEDIGKL